VGFAANNMVDLFQMTPNLLPCLVLVAYLVVPSHTSGVAGQTATSDDTAQPNPRKPLGLLLRSIVPAAALAGLVLSAIGWSVSDTAYFHASRSMRLADSGDLAGALRIIEEAMRIDPAMQFYATQRAQYLGILAARDTAYVDQALAATSAAVAAEDTYALLRANRSMLLAQSGDVQAALDEMKTAQLLDPREPRYPLWAGALADELGNREAARASFIAALEIRPQWVESGYWDETPLRAEARDVFLAQSGVGGRPLEEIEALSPECWPQFAQGNTNVSEAEVAYCEGEIDLRIEGDLEGALVSLDEAIQIDPAQAESYLLRGEVHEKLGDSTAATKDARTAIFLGDARGYTILGQIAQTDGDTDRAASYYQAGMPQLYRFQGWEGAVYGRRGALSFLPQLDAPGPSRRDFASALALSDLYDSQGRDSEAQAVRGLIRWLDPYFEFGSR
jgi:tetratricopeptide (TPR) repeat protein